MRYLWDLYPDYLNEWTSGLRSLIMQPFASYLRLWDSVSANRVDTFLANSLTTKRRIWRCYRRESTVVYPPVAVETFYWKPSEDYYLIVSELVPYKRIDTAVSAFTKTGRKLRIAGAGPDFRKLRKMAGPAVEFCGRISDVDLRELYARCRALVLPGEEDFGITAVEALASGKPVVALGRGGALETVSTHAPLAGVLYDDPSPSGLTDAISRFESIEERIRPWELQAHTSQFSEARFHRSLLLGLEQPPFHVGPELLQDVRHRIGR
jgi:glycosyltransferase involved in cell wall biosynthesis